MMRIIVVGVKFGKLAEGPGVMADEPPDGSRGEKKLLARRIIRRSGEDKEVDRW
jgi:hypothetical protein